MTARNHRRDLARKRRRRARRGGWIVVTVGPYDPDLDALLLGRHSYRARRARARQAVIRRARTGRR